MSGIIIKAITIDQIIALAPPVIYYSTLTCWWTHERLHLSRHPDTKKPCDPRGAMVYETKRISEFFRKASLSAREGVYGKHGLDAFIAAHYLNCLVSETDRRSTCFTTWREYNVIIDKQNKPIPAPIIRDADLQANPIPEKTVLHDPNPRVLGRDSDESDEGDEDEFDEDEDEDDFIIVAQPAVEPPLAVVDVPAITEPAITEPAITEQVVTEAAQIDVPTVTVVEVQTQVVSETMSKEPATTDVVIVTVVEAELPASTVQAGPDTIIPVKPQPSLQSLIDKNTKKDTRHKKR